MRTSPWTAFAALSCAALLACPVASATPDATDADQPLPLGPAAGGTGGDPQPGLAIGAAGDDAMGGWLPDGVTVSPFDVGNPIVGRLDPALLGAVQDAARAAAGDGVDVRLTSGWRTRGFQQRLFDDAVRDYGSAAAAARFVASPEVSKHVLGQAVDVAAAADRWMIAQGPRFGLCQIYANEIWHFELAADAAGGCPPLRPDAAG